MIDNNNLLRTIGKVLKVYRGQAIPVKVTQYLTYRCNLRCGFCGRNSIESNEMSTEQIVNCIKEFKALGTEFWGFNGGEPLLREDIGVLINTCKKLGIRTSMSTNGTLIPQKINDMMDLDLTLVSIDGPKFIHEKIRGTGTFDKAISGLEMLRSKNRKFIIVAVLNTENIPHLSEIIKIAENYNCLCEFQPVFMHHSDAEKKAAKYIPDQMKDSAEYLIRQKKSGKPIANSFAYLNKIKNYPMLPKKEVCWANKFFCVITPNGSVYPCCVMLSQKNIDNSGLDIGWEKSFRALPDMANCGGCFIFCYSEYNLILNNPARAFIRIVANLFKKTWISR